MFLPAPFWKKPQAPWPLNPQRLGPRGDEGRAEGRLCCNMWSPRLGRAKQFFFNWPCNLTQLGWITGENSSIEKKWGDWHTASCGLGGWGEGHPVVTKLTSAVVQSTGMYLHLESKYDQWKTLQLYWTLVMFSFWPIWMLSNLSKSNDKTEF